MSYTALYRKYRPNTFSEVIGQDATVKILKNSIIENKISHAYIFSGPRGTGKTSIAKILARTVNCLENNQGDLCGKCENCTALRENDTDIIEIDAASNNGVDEIREIRNNAKLMPNIGKYKVYIIDEVHMLSTGAFNALLKTLEEPPSHVIFILATTEIQKIPLTILSRCQKFNFYKIKNEVMKNHLLEILKKEERMLSDEILDLVVKLSDGCCRDAINLLDQLLSIDNNEITVDLVYDLSGDVSDNKIINILKSIINVDYKEGLNQIGELINSGKNLNNIINKMLIMLRNISLINNGIEILDKKECYIEFKSLSENRIIELTKILLELTNEIKKSTMQNLIFEIYFMKMCNLFDDKIARNDILEESVSNDELKKDNMRELNKNETREVVTEEVLLEAKNEMIDIRVDNTLSRADKGILRDLKLKFQNIDEFSSNKTFNNAFSILTEGKIVAASDEYLILSFEYKATVALFYKNLAEVENLLKLALDKKYKAVALTEDEWVKTKAEYINNRSKFEYTNEENEIIEDNSQKFDENENEVNSALDIFGEDAVTIK